MGIFNNKKKEELARRNFVEGVKETLDDILESTSKNGYTSADFDCDKFAKDFMEFEKEECPPCSVSIRPAEGTECANCGGKFNIEKMKAVEVHEENLVGSFSFLRFECYCKHCQPAPDEKYIDRNGNYSYYINNKQEVDQNCKKVK